MILAVLMLIGFNFSGEGQQATKLFTVEPGVYRVETWNTRPGEVFVCQMIRADQRQMPVYITTYPDQGGSAVFVIEETGRYYLNIVCGGKWRVVIELME